MPTTQPPQVISPRKPFALRPDLNGSMTLESAVFQALGAVSACWSEIPESSRFDSNRAVQIGETLLNRIDAHVKTVIRQAEADQKRRGTE